MTEKDTSKDVFFTCFDPDSLERISSLYGNRRTVVAAFLKDKCREGVIKTLTETETFDLIQLQLGYPIPGSVRKSVLNNS